MSEQHPITIVVNGRDKVVHEKTLAFKAVVLLAFPTAEFNDRTQYTVTYSRGPHEQHKGTLADGGSVEIKEGEVFNVTSTDRS